jgi:PAS domain S-box-containing protein
LSGHSRPVPKHEMAAHTRDAARSDDDGYAGVFWTAFRRSANAMFVAGLDRRIVAVNEPGTVLAGRSAEALIGERMTALLDDPGDAPDDATWRAQVLRGESAGRRRIRRPDGSTRVVEYAMRAARADGSVLVLGVCLQERTDDPPEPTKYPAPLTRREQEIVHRIAFGEVSADICAALHIAPDTVRAHVRNAMAKTGARTRAQLIAIALTEGLLED